MDTTWSTTTRVLVIVILLVLGVWMAAAATPILQVIGIAALLAYLLDPAKQWLMRRTRMRRSWASALICLLLVLLLASIPAVLGTVAVTQIYRLEEDFLTAIAEITQFIAQPVVILNFSFQPQDILGNLPVLSGDILALLPGGSLNVLSDVTTNVLWATAVVVTLYYLLKDGYQIKPWLVGLAPARLPAGNRAAAGWDRPHLGQVFAHPDPDFYHPLYFGINWHAAGGGVVPLGPAAVVFSRFCFAAPPGVYSGAAGRQPVAATPISRQTAAPASGYCLCGVDRGPGFKRRVRRFDSRASDRYGGSGWPVCSS